MQHDQNDSNQSNDKNKAFLEVMFDHQTTAQWLYLLEYVYSAHEVKAHEAHVLTSIWLATL